MGGSSRTPLLPLGRGVREGVLLQYQKEQKFAAKMRYVYSSDVGLTDI
jgi:hypothetical protein